MQAMSKKYIQPTYIRQNLNRGLHCTKAIIMGIGHDHI